jgi:hypothetical protein
MDKAVRWVARLTPTAVSSVDELLRTSMGLDVWERQKDWLVVAASEGQLSELERRGLAQVDRLSTVADFQARAERRPARRGPAKGVDNGSDSEGDLH